MTDNCDRQLVVKANALVDAAYSLTLAEQKTILFAITQVRRDQAVTDSVMYSIPASALAGVAGFAGNEYRNLKRAVDSLMEKKLTVYIEPNGGPARTRVMRWVQSVDYIRSEGRVEIRFAKDVLPYLNQITSHYLLYEFAAVKNMRCCYGIRLYEFLSQQRNIRRESRISIVDLRARWDLNGKYSALKDLRRHVIEPAVDDVNMHGDFDFAITAAYEKTGRVVSHVSFQKRVV